MERTEQSGGSRQAWLAAVALTSLYAVLRQHTWSIDGCLHTLQSVRSMDDSASGHVLLRPLAWAWTALWGVAGPLTWAQRYDLLHLLFGALGVASLVLLFEVVRRRAGAPAAWLALSAMAILRCTERQITCLDEKPVGMFTFALAVFVTDGLYRRLRARADEPGLAELLPFGLAWMFAVFGHLQNVPFALAATLGLAACLPDPERWLRWRMLVRRLALPVPVTALGVLALLHVRDGGFVALPRLLYHLFYRRPVDVPPPGIAGLVKDSLLGYLKAFFLVDRLSPQWALVAALVGSGVLVVALTLGARRARDPLAIVLVAGALALMVVIPAANFFPDFGDSYTMAVMGSFVLLGAAPRAWVLAGTLLLWAVNLPAALGYTHPQVSIQQHLARMTAVQARQRAPWVRLDELSAFAREQGLTPVYYAMWEPLRHERSSLASLPPGRFLLELPEVIDIDGTSPSGRVEAVRRKLAAHGRASTAARLWDPLREVRSDFRRYGDYLVVEAAPGAQPSGPGPGASPGAGPAR